MKKTERSNEKDEKLNEKDVPCFFLESFGPPRWAIDFLSPLIDPSLVNFHLVDLTLDVVVAGPASFGGFVGVRLSSFASLALVGGPGGWWLVVLRPCATCVTGHGCGSRSGCSRALRSGVGRGLLGRGLYQIRNRPITNIIYLFTLQTKLIWSNG